MNILDASRKAGESLNQISEWGGAKTPALLVTSSKGIAKISPGNKEEVNESQEAHEIFWKETKRGQKRLKYLGEDQGQ